MPGHKAFIALLSWTIIQSCYSHPQESQTGFTIPFDAIRHDISYLSSATILRNIRRSTLDNGAERRLNVENDVLIFRGGSNDDKINDGVEEVHNDEAAAAVDTAGGTTAVETASIVENDCTSSDNLLVDSGESKESCEGDNSRDDTKGAKDSRLVPDYTLDDDATLASSPPESSSSTLSAEILERATKLRLEGKEYHDTGDFDRAAELFQNAADSLEEYIGTSSSDMVSDDYATCRLHQALCHLKSEKYDLCLEACSDVLRDDVPSKPATSTPAVRARAYHRRSKAKLALGDKAGALQDARSAAFLGDRKAVAFYGRLMRDSPVGSSEDSVFDSLLNPSPMTPAPSSNSALLESLLSKSDPSKSAIPDFSPASLLFGGGKSNSILGGLGSGANGSGSGLAKSVMKSLSKRLEDESTHESICNFLQKTNKSQLQQFAAMAGAPNVFQDSHLDRIVSICHGVTPKTIKRTVKNTKRAMYGIKIVRKVSKIIKKYKSILVALLILQWTKSAVMRPIPIDRQAARRASKQALKDAMKASRKS